MRCLFKINYENIELKCNSLIWQCLNQMTSRPYDSFLMIHLMTHTTQSYHMTHMTFLYLIHYYSKPVNSLCHGPSDDDIYIKKVFFTLDQSPSPPATKNSFSLVSLLSVPILLQNSNNFMKIHNLDRKGYIRLYIFTQKSEISYDFLNFWSILDFFEHFKMILPLFSITLSWFLSDFRSKSLIFN